MRYRIVCCLVIMLMLTGCSFWGGKKDNDSEKKEPEIGTEQLTEAGTETVIEPETEVESEQTTMIPEAESNEDQSGDIRDYTFKLYTDPFKIGPYAVYKKSAKVYDVPSSAGKVIDTFGYKHLMMVVGKCNETGWYKIIYDEEICAESNYENHLRVIYDYESIQPAAKPEDTYFINFSRTAKNIKTGYINPKDVKDPAAWEDEVYHMWNGIKYYEFYSRSEGRNNFFKQLCYAPRYTIVEYDHSLGMFIPDPDESWEKSNAMFDKYANERGYLLNGGGGCWIDSKAPAYYRHADFLTFEEQYCEVSYYGGEIGYLINWDYMQSVYGLQEDNIWTCAAYVGSIICDKSIGTWDDQRQVVRYSGPEFVQVCKKMIEFSNSDIGKLPTIKTLDMRQIEGMFVKNEGYGYSTYGYYYLYLESDTEETIGELDKQLNEEISKPQYEGYERVESNEFYGEYQEGKVYKKQVYFPELNKP